jgi:hypothetical protein
MEHNYVIKNNKTESFIASDSSSGGYPYDTTINHARVFSQKDTAVSYKNLFPKEDWSLHALVISSKVTNW